jgi:hypothetical protein
MPNQKGPIMTATTPRLTAQGLRDLNYYGPKRAKAGAEPTVEATETPSEAKTDTDIQAVPAPVESAPPAVVAT